jgi:hypothetical protein
MLQGREERPLWFSLQSTPQATEEIVLPLQCAYPYLCVCFSRTDT